MSYRQDLTEFIDTHCRGKEFDSCCNSPCPYSSSGGCKHPEHPKNQKAEGKEGSE